MLARIFHGVPRNARPALVLSWIIIMILLADQVLVFGLRASHASGKTYDGAVSEMYFSGGVAFGLFVVLAGMFVLLLCWFWHWSDHHEDLQARRARQEIHLVEH